MVEYAGSDYVKDVNNGDLYADAVFGKKPTPKPVEAPKSPKPKPSTKLS